MIIKKKKTSNLSISILVQLTSCQCLAMKQFKNWALKFCTFLSLSKGKRER